MILSCQTLSKAFDISKKTLASTVGFSSKAAEISWIVDNNWAIHESPGRKPDWEVEKSITYNVVEKEIIYNSFTNFSKNRKYTNRKIIFY